MGSLVFQQDNATSHSANDTIKWFKDQRIFCPKWPPYSPDLNPIENLWGLLQDKLYKKNDRLLTPDDVWREAQKKWYFELNDYIENLYKSMPFRIEEVLERNGNRLDY